MQSASDRCAISGVIAHPDPTLQVDADDVLEEQETPPVVITGMPSSTSGPPSLMGLVQSSPHHPNPFADEEMLKAIRMRPFFRALRAVGMGLVPLAGILVVIGVHQHISADQRRPSEDPNLAAIGIRVNSAPTSTTSTARPAAAKKKARSNPKAAKAPKAHKTHKVKARRGQAPPARAKKAARSKRAQARARIASRKIHKRKVKAKARKAQQQRRDRRLRRHVKAARNAYARKQWKHARREARRALKIDRRNRKARIIDRFATRRLVRQKRVIKHQLLHAKKDMKRKHYRRARRRAISVLKLDPRNRRARFIKRYSERRMRRRRG